jgi:Tol biopolymer transport system component
VIKSIQIVNTPLVLLALMLLSFAAAGQQRPAESSEPKEEPIIFGAPTISTGFDEKSIAFAPDGESIYFTRGVKYANISIILVSQLRNGNWSTPKVTDFSGRYIDKDPVFSADGQKLYFSSDRPVPGSQARGFDIWMVERTGARWSQPRNLGITVNSEADETSPSITADGSLYFTSNRKNGLGNLDIYRARRSGDGFSSPENLGATVNSNRAELAVCVDPHERFLIFSSERPGFGSSDLYISHFENGRWLPSKNLGSGINTSAEEHSPSISPDGKAVFFSSSRGMGQRRSQDHRLSYKELIAKLRSAGNDSSDIYQIGAARVVATR